MDFVFDIDKAVAAAGFLAAQFREKNISVFFLMKIMYGAERGALATWHRPITGDSFASMKKGPILSRTYDLICGKVLNTNSDMVKWSQHFSPRKGNIIKLLSPPDLDYLSDREKEALIKSLKEIAALVRKRGLIADALHEQWPEWKNPEDYGRGSIPLRLREVLSEVVENEDEVEKILLEIRAVGSAKAALQVGV